MRKLSCAIAGAAALALCAAPAWALPSSKSAAVVGNIQLMESADTANNNPDANDPGWQTILETQMKVPQGKDIAIDLSLVCTLITDTLVGSKGGKKNTAEAQGQLEIMVEIHSEKENGTDLGPQIVIPGGPVVFCKRVQTLSAEFQGIFQTGDPFLIEALDVLAECAIAGVDCVGDNDGLCEPGESCAEDPASAGDDADDVCNGAETCLALSGQDGDGICEAGEVCRELLGDGGDDDGFCEGTGPILLSDGTPGGVDYRFASDNGNETCVEFVGTCLEQLPNGQIVLDPECLDAETVQLILETMDAHSFNFIGLNVKSGIQRIKVMARVMAEASLDGDAPTAATARALIGLASLYAEEIRLINSLGEGDITCSNAIYNSPTPSAACGDDADGDGVADFADPCSGELGQMTGPDDNSDGFLDDFDSDSDGIADAAEATEADICIVN